MKENIHTLKCSRFNPLLSTENTFSFVNLNKMKFKATPEAAIAYIKFSVLILFTWPPRLGASKRTKFLFEVGWCISWLISILLIVPLGYAAYDQRKNTLNFTKSICLAVSCAQVVAKMFIAMFKRNQFQVFYH